MPGVKRVYTDTSRLILFSYAMLGSWRGVGAGGAVGGDGMRGWNRAADDRSKESGREIAQDAGDWKEVDGKWRTEFW